MDEIRLFCIALVLFGTLEEEVNCFVVVGSFISFKIPIWIAILDGISCFWLRWYLNKYYMLYVVNCGVGDFSAVDGFDCCGTFIPYALVQVLHFDLISTVCFFPLF